MNGTVTCSECNEQENIDQVRSLGPVRDDSRKIVAYKRPNVCRRCRMKPSLRALWDELKHAEREVIENPEDYESMHTLRLLRDDWRAATTPTKRTKDVPV